ncbi:MAG: DUF6338 family protein [Candidatus Thiodiazotropha endolucinida]
MNITQETVNILFLLIPGFISARVLDSVITREPIDQFSRVIEALVFSLLIYAVVNITIDWQPLITQTKVEGSFQYTFTTNIKLLYITLAYSVVLPLVLGALIHNDLHTKFFRKIKITDKTSRSTVWQDVYVNEKRHVVAHLKDGRRIYGWPMYYSHKPKESYIYLFQPAWIDSGGKYIECETHGILLENSQIEFIEFMKKGDEDLSKCT